MHVDSVADIFAPAVLEDPYPWYSELRGAAPVSRIPGTSFHLVSTWDAVHEATSRNDDFSSNLTAALLNEGGSIGVFEMDPDGSAHHVLATGDDPWHARERKLVLPTLVAKRIRALEPAIAATSEQLWREGLCGNMIEWMSAMGDRLPMTIVAALIGLPRQDADQLVAWGYASTEMLGGMLPMERLAQVVESTVRLAGYLRDAFHDARARPADNLLGDLARAVNAAEIDEDTAILILVQLVGAGGESTAGLIGNAVRVLGEHPDVQKAVRRDPALISALLEETLRFESPFRGHHRHVTVDTTLSGVALSAGSHLLLLWGSANRDPAAFDNPDDVLLDRASPRRHLAFGNGAHFCVGAALARLEARITLQTLLGATQWFDIAAAQWLPSIFVRRHRSLLLEVR